MRTGKDSKAQHTGKHTDHRPDAEGDPVLRALIIALAVLSLAGCATGFRVTVDYDTEHDFSGLTGYAISLPEEIRTVPNPLVLRRVLRAVRAELEDKGLVEVSIEEADILFSFLTTSEDRSDVRIFYSYNSYVAYRACWRCPTVVAEIPATGVERVEFVEGQLIIDAINPATRELVWRGMTTKRFSRDQVSTLNPEKLTRLVNNAVASVLEDFPPP